MPRGWRLRISRICDMLWAPQGDGSPKAADIPMPSRLFDRYVIQMIDAHYPNNPEERHHVSVGDRVHLGKFCMLGRSAREKIKAKVSLLTCVVAVEQVLARTSPVQQPYLYRVPTGRKRLLTGMVATNRASREPVYGFQRGARAPPPLFPGARATIQFHSFYTMATASPSSRLFVRTSAPLFFLSRHVSTVMPHWTLVS